MKKLLCIKDSEEFWKAFNGERKKARRQLRSLPHTKKVRILSQMQKLFNNMSKKSGFTLIEILVATTILVITMASIYMSFRGGVTSWTKGTARMERYLNARAALDMMSREMRAAFIIDTGAYVNQFFYGESDNVTFIAPLRGDDDRSVLRTIKYGLNLLPGAPPNELHRIKEPSIVSDITGVAYDPNRPELTAPLVSHITYLSFAYYDGVGWPTAWDSTTGGTEEGRLPQAVRITIRVQDELRPEIFQTFSTIVYLPLSR